MALLLTVFVLMKLKKWTPVTAKTWKIPNPLALVALAFFLVLHTFGLLLVSWIFWIVLAESSCRSSGAWNPFQGYSWSFILMCIASGWALIATLLMYPAGIKLMSDPLPHALPYPQLYEEEVFIEPVPAITEAETQTALLHMP